jgi:protease I
LRSSPPTCSSASSSRSRAGRTLTSWPTLQTDIRNAGGNWVDKEVVVDDGIVTSRKPDDIPAFNEKMIEQFTAERVAARGGTL